MGASPLGACGCVFVAGAGLGGVKVCGALGASEGCLSGCFLRMIPLGPALNKSFNACRSMANGCCMPEIFEVWGSIEMVMEITRFRDWIMCGQQGGSARVS